MMANMMRANDNGRLKIVLITLFALTTSPQFEIRRFPNEKQLIYVHKSSSLLFFSSFRGCLCSSHKLRKPNLAQKIFPHCWSFFRNKERFLMIKTFNKSYLEQERKTSSNPHYPKFNSYSLKIRLLWR
jgi:hypothetical protein